MNNLTSPKTKQTSTPSSALGHVEVTIHTAIDSRPASSTKDGDLSSIISTSGQISRIVGDPLTVSLIEHVVSTCPLPTVSPVRWAVWLDSYKLLQSVLASESILPPMCQIILSLDHWTWFSCPKCHAPYFSLVSCHS